jgi:uncharacterized protein YcnI
MQLIFLSLSVLLKVSLISGHASFNPPVASSRYYIADVRITHGLNKTATDMVVVTIPESIVSVRVSAINSCYFKITF